MSYDIKNVKIYLIIKKRGTVMDIFYSTLTQMLVMFCFMIIGYLANRFSLLPENSATVLSKLENYVLVPALVFDTFMNNCQHGALKSNFSLILYCILLLGISLIISIPLAKHFAHEKEGVVYDELYQRRIYEYALTFGNFSFMGNAVVLGILGDKGLFGYLLFTLPLNIMVYTWGVIILIPKGKGSKNPIKNLLNPIVISLFFGIIAGLLNIKSILPDFVTITISSAKNCMGPVAMMLTGFVIGGYKLKTLLTKKRIYLAAALRLIAIPSVMLIIINLLGASKEIMTLALFAYATPLGLNTIVFPAAYGGDTRTGASMAMISHILCVITIPLMYLAFIA